MFSSCVADYECGVSWGIQSLFIEIVPGTDTLFLVVQIRIVFRNDEFSVMIMSPDCHQLLKALGSPSIRPFVRRPPLTLSRLTSLLGLVCLVVAIFFNLRPIRCARVTGRDLQHMTWHCEKKRKRRVRCRIKKTLIKSLTEPVSAYGKGSRRSGHFVLCMENKAKSRHLFAPMTKNILP